MGIKNVNRCAVRKILFCSGLTWAAIAGQKFYCTSTTSPKNKPRKDPFHMYSKIPHFPQFQRSAGATHLWSLWTQLI
jgi:hypothetical protein